MDSNKKHVDLFSDWVNSSEGKIGLFPASKTPLGRRLTDLACKNTQVRASEHECHILEAMGFSIKDGKIAAVPVTVKMKPPGHTSYRRQFFSWTPERAREVARIVEQQLAQFKAPDFVQWGTEQAVQVQRESSRSREAQALAAAGGSHSAQLKRQSVEDEQRSRQYQEEPQRLLEQGRQELEQAQDLVDVDPQTVEKIESALQEWNTEISYLAQLSPVQRNHMVEELSRYPSEQRVQVLHAAATGTVNPQLAFAAAQHATQRAAASRASLHYNPSGTNSSHLSKPSGQQGHIR